MESIRPDYAEEPIEMTERQRSVFDLLEMASAGNDLFGRWYQGALQALRSGGADSLAQAAHSIREITDRLPSRVGVPQFQSPLPKTQDSVVRLLGVRTSDYPNGWEGEVITEELSEILSDLEGLRPIFEATPRTQRLRVALELRDPYSEGITPAHRKARDKAFRETVGYFQKIAHHNAVADQVEFMLKLAAFEDLLLSYLSPVSVEQQQEILAIIVAPPSPASEGRLNQLLLHNGANLRFVLARLLDPDWLPFLEELGLFRRLREGERTV